LLSGYGLTFSSLLGSLYNAQVQELVWARYPDLRRLQHSCWENGPDGKPCNHCGTCRNTALAILAGGWSPGEVGMDTIEILENIASWKPRTADALGDLRLPRAHTRMHSYDAQKAAYIRALSPGRLLRLLFRYAPRSFLSPRGLSTFGRFVASRRRLEPTPPAPRRMRAGFLSYADEDLREGVRRILGEYFEPQDPADYDGVITRADEVSAWLTEPLRGASTPADEKAVTLSS
jgi:hypothetical protein